MMKKKFNNKIFLVLLLLPLMTGCDTKQYLYTPFSLGAVIEFFDAQLTNMVLGFMQFLNELNWVSVQSIQGSVVNSFTELLKNLDSLKGFAAMVGTVTTLAAVAIMIRFGWSIFKNNFMDADTSYAPDVFTVLKKIFVAIIAVYLIPTVFISSFVVSTAAGTVAVKEMISDESNLDWGRYTSMQKNDFGFSTYCSKGQETHGSKSFRGLNDKVGNGYLEIITPENAGQLVAYNAAGESIGTKDYNYWCGNDNNRNIWEAINYNQDEKVSGIITIGAINQDLGSDITSFLGAPIMLLSFCLVSVIGSFAMLKRLVELVFLIATSWYYVGASITDQGYESFGALGKKLLIICLSQFFFMFELGLFTIMSIGKGISPWMVLAWALVIMATPSAIREMVEDSGAGSNAASAGKLGWKFGRKFIGK